jgi:hypothetical protein
MPNIKAPAHNARKQNGKCLSACESRGASQGAFRTDARL